MKILPPVPVPSPTTRPYPVTDAERDAQYREHAAALDRIAQDMLGAVSVQEIEDVVFEMEDDMPTFARRIILQRRQMKRLTDAVQGMVGHEDRLAAMEARVNRLAYWEAV